jgi:putative transposase
MSSYRRWYVPGGTYFFTVVTCQRHPLFASEEAVELLGAKMREVREELPFETIAIVLLPDHLHAIWTLPRGDSDYSTRWKRLKAEFTKEWLKRGHREVPVPTRRKLRGSRGIWQRRYWEHTITDERDLENHCIYIHYNPVKHRYVLRPADWPHSSFHRFVKLGEYEPDWGRSIAPEVLQMNFE